MIYPIELKRLQEIFLKIQMSRKIMIAFCSAECFGIGQLRLTENYLKWLSMLCLKRDENMFGVIIAKR